jgi:dTDP-4-dehydrorhamnose reductase
MIDKMNIRPYILVTGGDGQLGVAIGGIVEKLCYFTDSNILDICDRKQLEQFVKDHPVRYIVNCAAYTNVDRAEGEPENCFMVNSHAMKNIGMVAKMNDIKVIHISTDYVFDGNNTIPYIESDTPNPQSVYGRSKYEGEQELLHTQADAVIIRTSWLYSYSGKNFVQTMLRLGQQQKEVRVVNDQIGTPTYALDLAEAILQIINYPQFCTGIYHFANQGQCSWYDFAKRIFELISVDCQVVPITTKEYPTPAKRPQYSVLSKDKITQTYGIEIPHWENALVRCISAIKN